jgi:hypothetical protein
VPVTADKSLRVRVGYEPRSDREYTLHLGGLELSRPGGSDERDPRVFIRSEAIDETRLMWAKCLGRTHTVPRTGRASAFSSFLSSQSLVVASRS